MADLIVRPSYQFTETDIVTVDKLNLLATPVVDLSLETPVNDQNYFRNGNFYSSFWTNAAGVPVPPGSWVGNANYWLAKSAAGTPTYKRSTDVPDIYSLFSAQIAGAVGVGAVSFGQQINGDLSATLRRPCTFSGYLENTTGQVMNPTLQFFTCNAFNNFNSVTLQATVNLQTCANATWTFVTATQDVSLLANAANGLFIVVVIPAGSLAAAGETVNFSRLKFQIGEVATEFSDDPSLFVQAPSVDSTMLQDGCIARPSLFLPNVIPQGTFVAGAIQTADIGNNQVTGAKLSATAVRDSLGYTPVNKGGDTGVGIVGFTTDTVVGATGTPGITISTTSANAANDGYDPAIGFIRASTTPQTRYIGLAVSNRFRTVDNTGNVGYLLDTVTGVDTASYQPGSITIAALAQSLIDVIIPAGMIRMFGGPNIPPGWLVCDGTAYAQSTYPALYAAIGTYWGAGSGAQQFNVPDLRGRSPMGYVNTPLSGITARAFGTKAGEEYHQLSVSELAYHNHTSQPHDHNWYDHGHYHHIPGTPTGQIGTTSTVLAAPGGSTATDTSVSTSGVTFNPQSVTTDNTGSNAGHNTIHPVVVCYFIIKT